MNSTAHRKELDWSLIQSFAVVAEQGSLTAAARVSDHSQPTMSRHIGQLEEALEVRLFDRGATGLSLTDAGLALVEYAREMSTAASQLSLSASGRSQQIEGTVRITASVVFATTELPSILCELRRLQPSIDIEVVASDTTENLLKREADIAIRMYRPTQSDVISKKVGEYPIGFFATSQYLDERGRPQQPEDLLAHDIVGLDMQDDYLRGFRAAGLDIDRSFFRFRCDHISVGWEMVRCGYGIGLGHTRQGAVDASLERVFPEVDIVVLPIWLTAHAELKTSRRIRYVYDFLARAIQEALAKTPADDK